MRLRFSTPLIAAAMLLLAAAASAQTGFSAFLAGSQEVPPVATPASGYCAMVLNAGGTSLSYNLDYSGLLANRTASHFHGPAAPGVNASVVFGVASAGGTSGNISGAWAIDATNKARLLAGLLYLNVHTSVFPGGEIRGQVLLDASVPANGSSWGRIKRLYR